MKKIIAHVVSLCGLVLSGCSPIDSVRVLDQQQTTALVKNMYPAEVCQATKKAKSH